MVEEKQSGYSRKEVAWLHSHRPAVAQWLRPYPAASPLPLTCPYPWPRLYPWPRPHSITFLADAGAVDGRAGNGIFAGAACGAVNSVRVRGAEASAVRALNAAGGLVSGGQAPGPLPGHPHGGARLTV